MTLDLEQIAEKESFLKKIGKSFINKLTLLAFAGTMTFAGCNSGEECISTLNKVCQEKTVYYEDTCGNPGIIKEHCACGCNSDYDDCKPCPDNEKFTPKHIEIIPHVYDSLIDFDTSPQFSELKPEISIVDYTRDWQFEGFCTDKPDGTSCSDDLWCNGLEECYGGVCRAGEPACETPCDEEHRHCVDIGGCVYDSDCDDGIMCNGEEWCCTGDNTQFSCEKYHCYDSFSPCGQPIWGVMTVCGMDFCEYWPDEPCYDACRPCKADFECDDGCFCNGHERCGTEEEAHHWGICMHAVGSRPCQDGEVCEEEWQRCRPEPDCWRDRDCDDGLYCNTNFCDENGKCQTNNENPCSDMPDLVCIEGDGTYTCVPK